MRSPTLSFLSLFICITLAMGQESPVPDEVDLPPKEAALDTLFSIPATAPELDEAIAMAVKLGVPAQTILEARFLYHVEHNDDKGIIALLPEFEKQAATFTLDASEIFSTVEDFQAVIEFARAIKSLQEKNNDAFKKHITEALWLSPAQASAFTPYIEKLRLSEHVKNTVFTYDVSLPTLSNGKPANLREFTDGKKSSLLHFWSPWAADCETATADLEAMAPELVAKNISLVHVLISDKTEIVSEAKSFLAAQEKALPGPQLIDRPKDRIANKLRVTDMPTMVLLSPEGKILFHGKPHDEALAAQLKLYADEQKEE